MKKITYAIITALILSLCLGITSFAADKPVATFSEDFREMYFNDFTYYQRDITGFSTNYEVDYELNYTEVYEYDAETGEDVLVSVGNEYYDKDNPFFADYKLSKSQEKIVDTVEILGDKIIVNITVHYKDSTTFSVDLIHEDYLDEYDALKSGKSNNFTIEYDWPDDNIVLVSKEILTENAAEKINVRSSESIYDFQSIYCNSEDGMLIYAPGIMMTFDDKYYYLDYAENKFADEETFWMELDYDSEFIFHEITDETVVQNIKLAEEAYYADDYGYLYNDELANDVSYFFLIIIFGVIPGIIFVITLVFAFIKKKTYRKLLFTASFLTLAEIIVFIFFMVVSNYK
jgi:hypothetical protein